MTKYKILVDREEVAEKETIEEVLDIVRTSLIVSKKWISSEILIMQFYESEVYPND